VEGAGYTNYMNYQFVSFAVACERELLEGLREIGGVPVICITNRRPEGPCKNTEVDLEEFEAAVRRLTGGGSRV
jgi:hypothetical protein